MTALTSTNEIEPNIDVYGTYARVSAIADFLEVIAVGGASPRRSVVADYIADVSWGSKMRELYQVPIASMGLEDEDGEGIGGNAEDAALRVFRLLVNRARCLKDKYPFSIDTDETRLEFVGNKTSPYLSLLGITIAHAFQITSEQLVNEVFEDTVARALRDSGHNSLNFSRLRSQHSSFEEALASGGRTLGLTPVPGATSISRYANDAGADVIVHIDSGYAPGSSVGTWTLVGQVTCGTSDTWKGKLREVEEEAWGPRLGAALRSQAFLAIPHHAGGLFFRSIVENVQCVVLDRLRLVRMLKYVSVNEKDILRAVLGTPVSSAMSAL